MDKRIASAAAAIEKLTDGSTILMGGFGLCGIPENLIAAVSFLSSQQQRQIPTPNAIEFSAAVDFENPGFLGK